MVDWVVTPRGQEVNAVTTAFVAPIKGARYKPLGVSRGYAVSYS